MLESLLALLATFLLSFVGTLWVRKYSIKKNILDIPNWRSQHEIPTPRGGGAAIVLAFFCVSGLASFVNGNSSFILFVGFPALAIALLGWLDDCFSLSAKIRLFIQLGMATFTSVLIYLNFPNLFPPSFPEVLKVLSVGISILFIAWMTNLYNFMDGSDGITSCQTISVSASAALLSTSSSLSFLYLGLCAATIGFLFWNWPPAKIFMGDVGSATLGFILAGLALIGQSSDALLLPAAIILNGSFIVDASVTLTRRFLTGQNVTEAHRSHAYQHAIDRKQSHKSVSVTILAINTFWLLPIAKACTVWPEYWPYMVVLAWFPLVWICFRLDAGVSLSNSPSANAV